MTITPRQIDSVRIAYITSGASQGQYRQTITSNSGKQETSIVANPILSTFSSAGSKKNPVELTLVTAKKGVFDNLDLNEYSDQLKSTALLSGDVTVNEFGTDVDNFVLRDRAVSNLGIYTNARIDASKDTKINIASVAGSIQAKDGSLFDGELNYTGGEPLAPSYNARIRFGNEDTDGSRITLGKNFKSTQNNIVFQGQSPNAQDILDVKGRIVKEEDVEVGSTTLPDVRKYILKNGTEFYVQGLPDGEGGYKFAQVV